MNGSTRKEIKYRSLPGLDVRISKKRKVLFSEASRRAKKIDIASRLAREMPVRMESSSVAIVMTSRGLLSGSSPGRQPKQLSEDYAGGISDSRFDNSLSPNAIGIDLSRSPSVGETFVSAATDGPLSSSGSDSDSSDDDVERDQLGRTGAVGSPSLNSNHNSATAFDRVPSLPLENNVGAIRPLSPGEGPSGSTSISMSIGSMGKFEIESRRN